MGFSTLIPTLGTVKFVKRALAAAAGFTLACAATTVGASAQLPNNRSLPQLSAGDQFDAISAEQMSALLGELGIQSQVSQSSPTARPNLLAQSPNGGRFYIEFLNCADDARLAGCGSVIYRAAMSNSGIAFTDLNAFNADAVVIKAINLQDRNLIYFIRHSIVTGGIGKKQLQLQTALFLNDMDQYVSTLAEATSVSFSAQEPQLKSDREAKISGFNRTDEEPSSSLKADAALIDSAIYNTVSVQFMTDEARAFLNQ